MSVHIRLTHDQATRVGDRLDVLAQQAVTFLFWVLLFSLAGLALVGITATIVGR